MRRIITAIITGLISVAALASLGPWPHDAHCGAFRERLRERLRERARAQPAPQADADVDTPITRAGDYTFVFTHDGLPRYYRVHVPASYSPQRATAVVLALHGGGGNMDIQAKEAYYHQISQADRAGYVVVFPNGYSALASGKFATWNAGRCCGQARDQDIDDVGFIRALLGHLRRQVNVDPRRIYANGMSNGAMMAYRLACEMSDTFTAIAAVAGTDNTRDCEPARPVSVLHIHAKDDPLEKFDGGAGRDSPAVTDFVAVPDSIAKWVGMNGCAAPPQRVFEHEGAYCDEYSSCRDDTRIKLCVTPDGGHSWPGGSKPRGNGRGSSAFSATEMMWAFFESSARTSNR